MPNYDVKLTIVIGKGFQCPLIEKPTQEEVNLYHDIYIQELYTLFNKYKKILNIKNDLEIYEAKL